MPSIRHTGVSVKVQTQPDRLQTRMAEAAAKSEHVWVVLASFELSDAAIRRSGEGESANLDAENLLDITHPGCLVCEEIWTPELAAAPCPGEP